MVVLRYLANGSLTMAKPCHLCLECMVIAGVRKVIYSDTTGQLIEAKVRDLLDEQVVYYTPGCLEYGNLQELRRYVLSRVRI